MKLSAKKVKSTPKRRVPTITFQPDDDVLKELSPVLKRAAQEKGYKTRWLNEVLRLYGKKGAEIVDAADKAAEEARRKAIGESQR